MYSSRGIGRQAYSDRKPNDRDRGVSERDKSSYTNSPDVNRRSDDREYERKANVYNERKDFYRNNSDDNSRHSRDERDSHTPPGRPPGRERDVESQPVPNPYQSFITPVSATPNPIPDYVPTPKASFSPTATPSYNPTPKPSYNPTPKPNISQNSNPSNYNPNPSNYNPGPKLSNYNPTPNPSNYNTAPNSSNYSSNPPFRPNNRPTPNPMSNSMSDFYNDEDPEPLTEQEKQEIIWEAKLKVLFNGVNSIDQLITLKEQYHSKGTALQDIFDKSKLREGEILRNKRRNRDDFKDPAMLENRRLREDIKRKLEEVDKIHVEIDKRIRAFNKMFKETALLKEEENKKKAAAEGSQLSNNYEAQLLQNTMISSTADEDDIDDEEDEYEYENQTKEYFDSGSHWCRNCDKMVPKIADFFEHLHCKEHLKATSEELQPWKKPKRAPIVDPAITQGFNRLTKVKTPLKGAQFLVSLRGFYCPLCKQYLGDTVTAEEHLKSAKHNRIYNRFICLHIDYEHKWNTDKGKALARHQVSERKRKEEEEKKELDKKKIKEEMKSKEEKEMKKKRREEERKEKEEREREKDDWKKKFSSREDSKSSSDRFRLKDVRDIKDDKSSLFSSFHSMDKDRSRKRDKDKQKKRTRIYSSSSDSSSSEVRPKKKPTYFGDPYKDPKLKLKSFVPLNRLNRKTAKQFHCRDLVKLIDEYKDKDIKKVLNLKSDTKREEMVANSPIKMDIDIQNEDETEQKDLNCVVDDILKGLGDDNDSKDDQKTSEVNNKVNEEVIVPDIEPEEEVNDSNSNDKKEDNATKVVSELNDSFESERQLQIDTDVQMESTGGEEQKGDKCDDSEKVITNSGGIS